MKRKAQSATEFVVLVSFMLVVFFVFFTIIQHRISDITDAQDLVYLKEANNVVLTEIELAEQVHADYTRTFMLSSLGDKSYTLELTDPYEITARFGDKEYVNFLSSPLLGVMKFNQNNTIYKLDGAYIYPNGTAGTNYSYSGLFMNVNPEECYLAHKAGTCSTLSYETDCNYFGLC